MSVLTEKFGQTANGDAVTLYTITNANGNSVSVMDYGATVQAIKIKNKDGNIVDCCLGYNTIEEYEKYTDYLGACIGRVGNRIGSSHIALNGKDYPLAANDGANHLHGGLKGFDKYMFKAKIDDDHSVTFGRISPDMEEGYPAEFMMTVSYIFDDYDELIINYKGWNNDEVLDTVVNLTNHTYFNLSGEGNGTILDHTLELYASSITEIKEGLLPTGKLLDVTGTPFDFRTAKPFLQDINADNEQMKIAGGYDHNFCVDGTGMRPCCILTSPESGIKMYVSTDMPGVQIYTGNFLTEVPGKSGEVYQKYSGVAIETQYYPDSLAHPEFPSPVLKANGEYRGLTVYQFDAGIEETNEEEEY